VLDPSNNLSGEAMEMIFSAMRFENDRWLTNLKNSNNPPNLVISDRGWFSHLAYTDHNVNEAFTKGLYINFLQNLTQMPDIVIYFNVDSEVAKQRMINRGQAMDAIELKGKNFQDKVRSSFKKYLVDSNIKVFIVDANQDIEGVRKQLDFILGEIL